MAEELPSDLATEWLAFYSLDPFGPGRGDVGPAIVASTVVQLLTGRRATPKDYLPKFGMPDRPDFKTLKAKLVAWVKSYDKR